MTVLALPVVAVERDPARGWRAVCACRWVGRWESREAWAQGAVVWHRGGHRVALVGRAS